MRLPEKISVLFVAGATLSACVSMAPSVAQSVAGMPTNTEWDNTLVTSKTAYTLAGCPGGCMPTDAVWNAVLEEDRAEMPKGLASQQQLDLDIQIGRLLPQARDAIAANDTAKIHDIGAKLEDGLNHRMQIIAAIANKYVREHPLPVYLPATLGTVPLGGYGAAGGSYAPSPGVNCIPVQGQGWTGCAPQ